MSSLLKVSYFQNLGELIDITVHLEQLAAKQLRTLVEAAQMAKKISGIPESIMAGKYFGPPFAAAEAESYTLHKRSYRGLHLFCFTMVCDWSINLAPSSQPIKCEVINSYDLVTRVFPRFRPSRELTLSSHWFIELRAFVVISYCDYIGFGFYATASSVL